MVDIDKLRVQVQKENEEALEVFAKLALKTFKRNHKISTSINPAFGKAFSEVHNFVLAEMTGKKVEKIEEVYRLWCNNGKNTVSKKDQKILDEIQEAEESIGDSAKLTSGLFSSWVKGSIPSKKSIVKYAIACKIDLLTTVSMLRAGGYQFNLSSDKEYAWAYLIMYYSGKSMNYCNEKLQELGFDKKTDSDVFLNKRVQSSKSKRASS